MFGFKKKEQKPLWIMGNDVMEIIRSDYEADMSFALVEFHYQERHISWVPVWFRRMQKNGKKTFLLCSRIRHIRILRNFRKRPVSTVPESLN